MPAVKPILVIDTGTSSMRGLLMDESGNIIDNKYVAYNMTINGESATQNPEDFSNALLEICSQLKSHSSTIAAITLTSQRSSVLPVDRKGKPMDHVMMWYDKRSLSICESINGQYGDDVYQICGMLSSPVLSAPKIRWYKDNRNDIYNSAYKFLGIHDYLLYQITERFVTDVTLASRTNLMDVSTGCWSEKMCALYGISSGKLCELVPVGKQVGTVTSNFSSKTGIPVGIPVISAGGDQQCSALGLGLISKGEVGVTAGSGAYVVDICDRPALNSLKRITLCCAAEARKWIREVSCPAAGTTYDWSRKILQDASSKPRDMDRLLEQSQPGANGVIMIAGLVKSEGVFLNMGIDTSKSDMARAVFEGIISEIANCYRSLYEDDVMDMEDKQLIATGGLSRFFLFNQILADMLNVTVKQCHMEETTGLGAWAQAAAALGIYPSAAAAIASVQRQYTEYKPNPVNYEIYRNVALARNYCQEQISHHIARKMLLQGGE